VLSDAQLRATYDDAGKEGMDIPKLDPSALYEMLFGSEKFEFYIGELKVLLWFYCPHHIPIHQKYTRPRHCWLA
jgi:hypothetical protein